MNILRVKIHDKIKDDSIEFKSLLDDKKQGSFLMQNLNAFDVLGNKREEIDINREMEISLEDFKILHFNNVLVSNGGGVFANNKLVREALSCFDCGELNTQLESSYKTSKSIKSKLKTLIKSFFYYFTKRRKMALSATPKIIFFCPWFDNFTHFCLEAYPRLYAAIKELESSNKEYFVVVPPKRREFDTKDLYQSFINPILLSLNITEDKRIYTNTYNKLNSPGFIMLNNVYLPSHVKWNETYIMNAINHLKNYYYDESFKWEYENIYISRKNASRRKIVNEDEVIAYLAKYNFKSIEMEDLSFKERINILMRTKRMIGIDGTNLTGMIFMPEDSSCVALRCYDMQEFNYFSASVARINFYVIVCEIANKIPNIHGEYWFFSDLVVDINILESKLKEYGVL